MSATKEKFAKLIKARIRSGQQRKLRAIARRLEVSQSHVVRLAVKQFVEREETAPTP